MAEYRPEFEKGLGLLARAFDAVCEKGHSRPVLVGGAVVEYYTGGLIHSGDFDISTISQDVLERELEKLGFVREVNGSRLARGLFHPHLDMGVEVVSKPLFDGKSDLTRLVLVRVAGHDLAVPPVEDMIADRMGQFNSRDGGVPEMLDQAIKLYLLASEVDETYLEERIRQETLGDYGLQFLKAKADGPS